MSGGKGGSTTSTTKPWKPLRPYILGAANTVQDTFDQNQPAIQGIASNLQSYLPDLATKAFGTSPLLGSASSYAMDTLSNPLGTNPYLEDIIKNSNADVINGVNGAIGTRGLTGGSAQTELLARELAKNDSNLRYTDYTNQEANKNAVLGQVPALNSAQYAGVPAYLAAAQEGAALPFTGSTALASGISGLSSPYSTTTQTQGGGGVLGGVTQGLGLALTLAAMGSDRRLKRFIRKVGELVDGLSIYRWQYKWGGPERIGVMADEVAKLRPWALGPTVNGFKTVDYSKIVVAL